MSDAPTKIEKIEVIQKLARGMAHEMNNILAIIMGLASVIESELDPTNPLRRDVEGILAASKRGHELTRNLLGFAHEESHRTEPISVNHLVGMVRSLLQQSIPAHIDLRLELGDDVTDIVGDPDQIKHALINLTSNAIDAIRSSGTLSISTKNVTLGARDLESTPELKPGAYVRVQVADTGAGMDQKTLEHAFDPFFSTKAPGTGSGLGLSLVYSIVKRHGGKISLFSKPGLGTTVTMHFPAAAQAHPEVEAPPTKRRAAPAIRGNVLVVDDETMIRRTVKRLLNRLGYTAVLASDGEEALEIYQEQADEISFVLLDLIMPAMDGAEVMERLKQMDPEVPIIILSGFWKQEQVAEFRKKGAVGFLRKPFTLDELAEQLESAQL